MAEQPKWKLVVIGVIFKRMPDGPRVLLQIRRVQNRSYDSLYDGTWEAMGETIEMKEDVFAGLVRGCAEEYGHPNFVPLKIYPKQLSRTCTTGKEDVVQYFESYCNVHSLGPPQPWSGYAFAVEVLPGFEPDYSRHDGEADSGRWWKPIELLAEIKRSPFKFSGLTMPAVEKVCKDLLHGKL